MARARPKYRYRKSLKRFECHAGTGACPAPALVHFNHALRHEKALAQKLACNKTLARWFMHMVSTAAVRNFLKYKPDKPEESFSAAPFSV